MKLSATRTGTLSPAFQLACPVLRTHDICRKKQQFEVQRGWKFSWRRKQRSLFGR